MTEKSKHQAPVVAQANAGYAQFQLAKALTASVQHGDAAARARAVDKAARWEAVLANFQHGSADYGSRTPLAGIPAWATLEVMTGGFATGALLAGGPLRDHELALMAELSLTGADRTALNTWFLTDAGMVRLQDYLRSGCYDVLVPEEGALLAVAWLAANGEIDSARELIADIAPFFARLRFYPVPRDTPRVAGSRVHCRTVGQTLDSLHRMRPHARIAAQQAATSVWTPLYDRMVALFLETVAQDWPCRIYPDGWRERGRALLDDYARLTAADLRGTRFDQAGEHRAQLRTFLQRCVQDPAQLSGREVGRIRLILQRYVAKRGAPDSAACRQMRQQHVADVSAPSFQSLAQVLVARMDGLPKDEGLDQPDELMYPVTSDEAARTRIGAGTALPPPVRARVERCLNDTVAVLVERGLITSGEVLAQVLPQMTSGIRAAGVADPVLRALYGAIYRAFRCRRSLLLLNLEKQVQLEELPWVAAINRLRIEQLSSQEIARQTLEEIAVTTLTAFPHVILPNKLLQELEALVDGAGLEIVLVNELATDIFMGSFSPKFLAAATVAAGLLTGSLYATYYAIDYAQILALPDAQQAVKGAWWRPAKTSLSFAEVCAARAGVQIGTWDPAANGMIIEQQQILTTQNLAALFSGLALTPTLQAQLAAMAGKCFSWICRRQQTGADDWHASLIMLKNTAYAWRQMIFFLSLMPRAEVEAFMRQASAVLQAQPDNFQRRFAPVMQGLAGAVAGVAPDSTAGARRFLGWSKQRHWLLPASV